MTKEELKAKFTDELLTDCGELFELFWRVECDTEKGFAEYDIAKSQLDKFLDQILGEGLERMWIQPPSVKILNKESKRPTPLLGRDGSKGVKSPEPRLY